MNPEAQAAYDEALKEIEACRRKGNKGTALDLSGRGLTQVPPEIGELTALSVLYLFYNQLTNLPPEIGQLAKLTELRLDNNAITSLPPEIGQLSKLRELRLDINQITSLPPEIGQLSALTQLHLDNNQLKSLPPEIGQLSALTQLHFQNNEITSLPPEIGQLYALTQLHLDDNQLKSLPPEIGQLSALTQLNLQSNRITSLPTEIGQLSALTGLFLHYNDLNALPPEIGQLSALTVLHLFQNQLTALPPEIGQLSSLMALHLFQNQLTALPPEIGQLKALKELTLNDNQLTALPPELRQLTAMTWLFLHDNVGLKLPPSILGPPIAQCNRYGGQLDPARPADILDYYFNTMGVAGRALREVKVILVGRGEVGKTSMVEVLRMKKFEEGRARTDGIAITPWPVTLRDGAAELVLWDFGGQEIMHGTHQFFLTHRSLYVVMVDGRHDRGRQDAEYWLKMVRAFGGDSPVLVVMNRQKGHPFALDAEMLSKKYDVALEHFFRTDCEAPKTIQPLRLAIQHEAERMLAAEERFPARCWDVKTRLAQMKQHGEDYLSEEDFQDVCMKYGVAEEQEQQKLLRRLADLGTVVSFPDDVRMAALSVLNPEWATDGIYRVVTNDELREKSCGLLTQKKLRELLPKDRWPKDLHVQYVLDLMRKFDLCFPVDEQGHTMLVPELLPDHTPPLGDWDAARCVVFQYRYPVLPHGVLPRFTTRTHALSEGQSRWRSGVVLVKDGAEARLQADYDANTLTIWVRGDHANSRRALLTVIRHEFSLIHARIEGLNPEEEVAVPGHPEVLVLYSDVIKDERRMKTTFTVTVAGERVDWPITELLDGVESAAERRLAAKRALKENYIMNIDNRIIIQGDNNGQVAQTMENCTQMIQNQNAGELKSLLEKLEQEVAELLLKLPEEKREEAAGNLELLTKAVTSTKPNRAWYSVSSAGLLEAAAFVKDFTGNIAGTLGSLTKVVGL